MIPERATSVSPSAALLTLDGHVATVTLNRPDRLNAIDVAMAYRLRDVARELATHPEVRVIVVAGAGPAFCAGGDIDVFAQHLGNMTPIVTELLTAYHEFVALLAGTPKLVLTSVHGAAAGAGLSLAVLGDLCIAADDARFTPGYAKLGVSPDGGGTVGLVRAAGARRALQIFLAEDHVTAAQALDWGLVCKVVPRAELAEETSRLARRLARTEPAAVAATKALIRRSAAADLHEQLEAEMTSLTGCMEGPAFEAAIRRFVGGGRPPEGGAT